MRDLKIKDRAITNPQPLRWPAALSRALLPAPKSKEQRAREEEAATPGQPVRARALFWNVPR